MKIIALPDLHGSTRRLGTHLVEADIVVLVGDITNGFMVHLETVLDVIREHNPHILAIAGNMDSDAINERLTTEGINLHGAHRVIDGLGFVGVGGALPYYGPFVFSEEELTEIMTEAYAGLPDMPHVLLAHQPPYNTLNDTLADGQHVGSHTIRRFIEEKQPLVCFTGHIHDAVGTDTIGNTKIVNPGRGGRVAFAEIVDGKLLTLEIRE